MRLALLGVGLIGGSFALAVRAAGKVSRIVGFDTDPAALRQAVALGVIDDVAITAAQAVVDANIVMIATPVGSTRQILRDVAPHLSRDAIVTDVGSTKGSAIEAAREELGAAFPRFVPGHPIAGREHSGVEHSNAELFRDKKFITTSVAQTQSDAVQRVEALWDAIGCRIERMTPQEHDNVFAAVSHLPHLLAFALVAHIAAQPDAARKFALAGDGFRDFTRLAGSNATMWSDICVANRGALGIELHALRAQLERLERAVDEGDGETLRRVFQRAVAARANDLVRVD